MSRHGPDPLDAQERALARRLAQLDANAAPSPALDQAILAAARAEDGAARGDARRRPVAPRRRPRGWPMGLGIAASLAVAVGVAWQLRPQPDTQVLTTASESAPVPAAILSEPRARRAESAPAAPVDSSSDLEPATEPATEVAPAVDPPPTATTPVSDASAELASAAAATDALAAEAEREQAEFQQAARERRARQAAEEAGAGMVLDRIPPPPPPPAPAAPAPAERGFVPAPPQAAGTQRAESDPRPLTQQQRAARASAERLDEIVVTGSRVGPPSAVDAHADQPLDDQPPASADSPAVREAWLQRVRELRDAGEVDAARASLREFVRRHPQATVPDDLRALLEG
jgi:hypothetical protein